MGSRLAITPESRARPPSPPPAVDLTGSTRCRPLRDMSILRRAGIAAALAAAPLGLAYRFALAYRVAGGLSAPQPAADHAGRRRPALRVDAIESDGLPRLPAWFIPARGGAPGPGVVLVHGWESARDRTLPMAAFLNAAGSTA